MDIDNIKAKAPIHRIFFLSESLLLVVTQAGEFFIYDSNGVLVQESLDFQIGDRIIIGSTLSSDT